MTPSIIQFMLSQPNVLKMINEQIEKENKEKSQQIADRLKSLAEGELRYKTVEDFSEACELFPLLAPTFEGLVSYGFNFDNLFFVDYYGPEDLHFLCVFSHSNLHDCFGNPLNFYPSIHILKNTFQFCMPDIAEFGGKSSRDAIAVELPLHTDPNKIAYKIFSALAEALDP